VIIKAPQYSFYFKSTYKKKKEGRKKELKDNTVLLLFIVSISVATSISRLQLGIEASSVKQMVGDQLCFEKCDGKCSRAGYFTHKAE